jgi:nitrite reductase (NO-forming)
MRRFVSSAGLVALAVGGVLAGVLVPIGLAGHTNATATKTITVSATEFAFKLSTRSVPVGTTVNFKVVNKGKIGHNFSIAGKTTKLLLPGASQTLTVKFSKKGVFPYKCTVVGHAAAGMKGKFAVGQAAPPPGTTSAPPPTTTTHPPPTTTGPIGNAQTTVTVTMVDYAFQLSQTTIPSGQVTFVISNHGNDVHNFDLNGVKAGAIIGPGQSETWTVGLAPGQYLYTCDVPFHVDRGMTGNLQVTP